MAPQGTSMEEAQLLLDDHTIKSQAMQSSPAAEAFEERIELWAKKLTSMQDIFDAWLLAQVRALEQPPGLCDVRCQLSAHQAAHGQAATCPNLNAHACALGSRGVGLCQPCPSTPLALCCTGTSPVALPGALGSCVPPPLQQTTCTQAKWMYLGPVYGSEEISKQMPRERFEFQVCLC